MLYTQSEFDAITVGSSVYTGIIEMANSILPVSVPAAVNFPNNLYNPIGEEHPQTVALSTDTQRIFLLSVAYKLTHNTDYAQKAQSLITNLMTEMTGVYKDPITNKFNMKGANLLPFFIPCVVFGADLVKSYGTFDNTAFKNWLGSAISVCSAKILDTYEPNNNNINTAWNMLDTAIAIYKGDTTAINACKDYWKVLINDQIVSANIIPPLKDSDADTSPIPVPFTILSQEIDRSDTYTTGTGSQFHSGVTQGIRGIHYTNFALMNFVLTVRLLANKGIYVAKTSAGITPEGQKLKEAMETTALFVLNPQSSPYYYTLLKNNALQNGFFSINDTSYMRLYSKQFGVSAPLVTELLETESQIAERYLIIPLLSKRWIA
jgi:hypothetical protein